MTDLESKLDDFRKSSPLLAEFSAIQINSEDELRAKSAKRRETCYSNFQKMLPTLSEEQIQDLEERLRDCLDTLDENDRRNWLNKAIVQEEISFKIAAQLRILFPARFRYRSIFISANLCLKLPSFDWTEKNLSSQLSSELWQVLHDIRIQKYDIIRLDSSPPSIKGYHFVF